jgi:hypothetical protein
MEPTPFHTFGDTVTAGTEELRGQQVCVALLMGKGVHPHHGFGVTRAGLAKLEVHASA